MEQQLINAAGAIPVVILGWKLLDTVKEIALKYLECKRGNGIKPVQPA